MAALRRKLDFPQSSGRGERSIAFAVQAIENQLQQVLAWIAANDTSTDAQRVLAALPRRNNRRTD